MTKVKAQDIASKLIGLDFAVTIIRIDIDNFSLRVENSGIAASTISTFATSNAINAMVQKVELT